MTLEDCPRELAVLFVPGGTTGMVEVMKDQEVFAFLKERGDTGNECARRVQLVMEYAPAPPFKCGTPAEAGAEMTRSTKTLFAGFIESARGAAQEANSDW